MPRILCLLALAMLCRGQPTPTFRASTTLIEFTIVAVDSEGAPVTVAIAIAEVTATGQSAFHVDTANLTLSKARLVRRPIWWSDTLAI
jgi:hypothetical protein